MSNRLAAVHFASAFFDVEAGGQKTLRHIDFATKVGPEVAE